jgi:hypothetical protein
VPKVPRVPKVPKIYKANKKRVPKMPKIYKKSLQNLKSLNVSSTVAKEKKRSNSLRAKSKQFSIHGVIISCA